MTYLNYARINKNLRRAFILTESVPLLMNLLLIAITIIHSGGSKGFTHAHAWLLAVPFSYYLVPLYIALRASTKIGTDGSWGYWLVYIGVFLFSLDRNLESLIKLSKTYQKQDGNPVLFLGVGLVIVSTLLCFAVAMSAYKLRQQKNNTAL